MNNAWHTIWNNRFFDKEKIKQNDIALLHTECKRASGCDSVGSIIPFASWKKRHRQLSQALQHNPIKQAELPLTSVFEIGCGAGANLLLFSHDGVSVGGIDYSHNLIEAAKTLVSASELSVMAAADFSATKTYDAVISDGVFPYFEDFDYATAVLQRACQKAHHAIAILDILDADYQEHVLQMRRAKDPQYDQKYKDLHKTFYPKAFFENFARNNHLDIVFYDFGMPEYWNSQYTYDVVLYK